MGAIVGKVFSVFFEYDTPRIVHIKSKKVGVINRFLQLCIIGYVIGYAIVFKKGYQEFDDVQGAVTSKLKGVARTNFSARGERIWDVNDYVVPPQENNAFFVITNLIVTDNQHMDVCEEDIKSVSAANCTLNADICVAGEPFMTGDGFMTGECIDSLRYPGSKSCQISAWCPTENGSLDPPNPPVLQIAENFTVFIKNNIEFPKFGVKRRNIPNVDNDTLKSCRYDPNSDPHCPIFQLNTIVLNTHTDDFKTVALKGGVIQIILEWNCNLDHSEDQCVPEYTFRRLDSSADVLSQGYNFRFARYYKDNGTDSRTLFKAYGIKFILTLQGRAGKFNFVPLFLNIGSGLALLSIATIVCDIVVLYVLKARDLYKEKKYLEVVGDDAYQNIDEDSNLRTQ